MTEQQSQADDSQGDRNGQMPFQPEDDGCQYVHRHCERKGQTSGLPRHGDSRFCFWHDPDRRWREDESVCQQRRNELGRLVLGNVCLEGAELSGAQVQGAWLNWAQLQGTILREAHFDEETSLGNAGTDEHTDFTNAHWPPGLVLRDELEAKDAEGFRIAAAVYRNIRRSYQWHGGYSMADAFYFREMECLRKAQPKWKNWLFWTPFYKLLCGYGTKPHWTLYWLVGVWGLMAFVSSLFGIETPQGVERLAFGWHSPGLSELRILGHGLIVSLASLATMTFADLTPATETGEFLASAEGLVGVLLAAVFIVSFARKIIR